MTGVFHMPGLAQMYDHVTEDWPFEARMEGWPVGSEPGHSFPHDLVEEVGSRLGECAWTAFVDTTGLFFDSYGRPLR